MNKNLNIPNALSFYRILIFPVLLLTIFKEYERVFSILLIINLITDILDGFIARKFNLQTELGARLDSIADTGTFIAAFWGVFAFHMPEFQPYMISFLFYIGLFLFTNILALVKFGRMPSLHLYSWKIGGYIKGIFFGVLFLYGFITPFYIFMISWAILECIEHITIQLLEKEMKSNSRGLYWVLKERINQCKI
jgi:cardiolipin synthase (CMP-forming)